MREACPYSLFAAGMNEWNGRRLVKKLHGDLASKDAEIEKLDTKN